MLDARDLSEDIHLQPGDFIFVPQSRISEDPQICSDELDELVCESNAVLRNLPEIRSEFSRKNFQHKGAQPPIAFRIPAKPLAKIVIVCSTRHEFRNHGQLFADGSDPA